MAAPVLGVVLLGSLGFFQWRVLREHVPGAARWIPYTALAWLSGLAAFAAFTSPLWRPGQPAALVAAIGIGGGLLMAAVVAAVSGALLVRLPAGRTSRRGGARSGRR